VFRVYFVSETAQVELRSGRVSSPAHAAEAEARGFLGGEHQHLDGALGVAAHVDFESTV